MIRHALATLLLGASLLFAGPAGVGPSAVFAQGCLSQGEARAAVASGQAKSFAPIHRSLQNQGKVVSSCLTRSGGGFAYLVQLLLPDGRVVSRRVSAN
jgi:hypothetical protein